jgi:YHS domain-containing protein
LTPPPSFCRAQLRALLGALVLLLALAALGSGCPARGSGRRGYAEPPPDGTEVTCPVSGDRCKKNPATPSAVYEMRTYYFCCDDCPKRFAEAPERYGDR